MCEGASKQTQDLKILPRRYTPPRFEIPGSATVKIVDMRFTYAWHLKMSLSLKAIYFKLWGYFLIPHETL